MPTCASAPPTTCRPPTCLSMRSSFCRASTVPLVSSFTTALFLICTTTTCSHRPPGQQGPASGHLRAVAWTAQRLPTHHLGPLRELERGEGLGEVLLRGRERRHQEGLGVTAQRVPASTSEHATSDPGRHAGQGGCACVQRLPEQEAEPAVSVGDVAALAVRGLHQRVDHVAQRTQRLVDRARLLQPASCHHDDRMRVAVRC